MNKFAERFKELRIEKNLSQEDISKALNYKQSGISKWEKGKTEPPYDILIEIVKFFGVTADYLLGLED